MDKYRRIGQRESDS